MDTPELITMLESLRGLVEPESYSWKILVVSIDALANEEIKNLPYPKPCPIIEKALTDFIKEDETVHLTLAIDQFAINNDCSRQIARIVIKRFLTQLGLGSDIKMLNASWHPASLPDTEATNAT